jgi:hypothetical protein
MKYVVSEHKIEFKETKPIYWRVTLKIIPAQITQQNEEK